ncbi:heavy metal-associated isoprenylated plant protein 8-like [Bidens hawaiensis]|uniref:heavy metal-associated isoprenylated plant protein 8-like n=1 Tax=Bidens hawaiensis TaxID=980011 RepID=UPI00404A79BF
MNTNSLHSFSNIAYQCLKNREERPTMKEVVDRLQEALDHQQEVIKKPEDEKKGEEEAKRIAGDDEDLNYSPLSPPGQDIILSTHMHCEDCAKKVRKYLEGLEGVESVLTNCETQRVIVKGEKADPMKVLKRLQKKIRKKVELVPLEYILPTEKEDEVVPVAYILPATEDERKKEDLNDPTQEDLVSLSMDCFCEGCVQKVRKYTPRFEGSYSYLFVYLLDINFCFYQ